MQKKLDKELKTEQKKLSPVKNLQFDRNFQNQGHLKVFKHNKYTKNQTLHQTKAHLLKLIRK